MYSKLEHVYVPSNFGLFDRKYAMIDTTCSIVFLVLARGMLVSN
jgi:hypothetical protein